MTPWRRNDRSRFLYQRCVCVRCRTFRINGLSGANLDLSFVLLKRNNNVATLNNIAANYLDDHSALLLISGSMPILSFHETLDNKNPYGTDVEYTVLLLQGVHNSLVLDHLPTSFFFSIVHKYNPCYTVSTGVVFVLCYSTKLTPKELISRVWQRSASCFFP